MEDQAANLSAKGIPCAHISSAQPEKQRQAVLKDLSSPTPRLKLVLVTPELIATPRQAALLDCSDIIGIMHCSTVMLQRASLG
jgi:superfamily II DNA helicase RecQ